MNIGDKCIKLILSGKKLGDFGIELQNLTHFLDFIQSTPPPAPAL